MMMFNRTFYLAKTSPLLASSLRAFGSTRRPINDTSFSFPRHKEFQTDDYFADFDDEYHGEANPYGNKGEVDFEDWTKPVHKKTQTGILSTYKKQLNLTAKDVMEKDFWANMNTVSKDIERSFEASDRKHYTKEIVDRLRLGREVKAATTPAGEDYGNYKKFENDANSVTEKNDKGEFDLGLDVYKKNLRKMMEDLNFDDEGVEGKYATGTEVVDDE
jgi:hypothetical protein